MKNPFSRKDNSSENNETNSGILKKISKFFSPEPQKEKVLRHEDFKAAGDTYYATVSAGYKISQRILILILTVFLVFSLITNFREITYDNFFYLIKDFSAAVDIEASNYQTLSYDSDSRHFFALYRGGLTIANPSRISVFTATGRRTMDETSKFSSPCIESSNKYFIIYDTAGTKFSIYNSFSKIYTEDLDYPITAAAFSEDGKLAVITRDISHKSLVHVYNNNFKRLFTVPSDKYAFDVELSNEYDKIAIAYYDIGNGSGRTEIVIRNISDTAEYAQIDIDGEFLLTCGFLSDERFAVITDRSVRIYDRYFEEYEAYDYGNGVVSGFTVNEQGAAVSYTLNSKNIAIVFDKSGNLLYNESINDNIKDINVYDEYVFLRTDMGVIRVNAKNGYDEFLSAEQGDMLIYSSNTVLVCGNAKAEYLVFED